MKNLIKKSRGKAQRILNRVDRHLNRSSRSNTPEPSAPENASQTSNNPAPIIASLDLPSLSSSDVVAPPALAGIAPTPASLSINGVPVPAVAAASEATMQDPSPSDVGAHTVPALIVSAPLEPEAAPTQTTWTALKTLGGVLKGCGDMFGPLKSAIGAISECVEVYEVRAQINFVLYFRCD
jgi:hypothetical protein